MNSKIASSKRVLFFVCNNVYVFLPVLINGRFQFFFDQFLGPILSPCPFAVLCCNTKKQGSHKNPHSFPTSLRTTFSPPTHSTQLTTTVCFLTLSIPGSDPKQHTHTHNSSNDVVPGESISRAHGQGAREGRYHS